MSQANRILKITEDVNRAPELEIMRDRALQKFIKQFISIGATSKSEDTVTLTFPVSLEPQEEQSFCKKIQKQLSKPFRGSNFVIDSKYVLSYGGFTISARRHRKQTLLLIKFSIENNQFEITIKHYLLSSFHVIPMFWSDFELQIDRFETSINQLQEICDLLIKALRLFDLDTLN